MYIFLIKHAGEPLWLLRRCLIAQSGVVNIYALSSLRNCCFEDHHTTNAPSFPGPNGNETKQPAYPGFERDVLRTVADYFQRLKEPLLTFHLYEVFVNILSECLTMALGCVSLLCVLLP